MSQWIVFVHIASVPGLLIVWGSAWIWIALVVFLAIGVVMNRYAGRTIDRIADTEDAEMERLLAKFDPGILAVTGIGRLLLVL